jgi:hypothetical protein
MSAQETERPTMEISQDEKIGILISFYQQVFEEMRRYRDIEWKILLWTVILMGGIVTATHLAPVKDIHKPYVQTLLCIFTVVAAIYGAWHIHFAHKRLTWYRNIRRRCDRIFEFFEENAYDTQDCKPILPSGWRDENIPYTDGLPHLICWWGLIALMAIYAIYSIAFM